MKVSKFAMKQAIIILFPESMNHLPENFRNHQLGQEVKCGILKRLDGILIVCRNKNNTTLMLKLFHLFSQPKPVIPGHLQSSIPRKVLA